MARISGVDLPSNKRIEVGLTYIYGIGRPTSRKILTDNNIDFDTRVRELKENEIAKLSKSISDYRTEGDLRREISLNIKRIQDLGSYKGLRHRRKLPANGQRTKTNARTRKGPRKLVVGAKK